jgi:hypothetical protein
MAGPCCFTSRSRQKNNGIAGACTGCWRPSSGVRTTVAAENETMAGSIGESGKRLAPPTVEGEHRPTRPCGLPRTRGPST